MSGAAHDLLSRVQLSGAGRVRSSAYSGGMKRRLSVALALVGDPHVLFLDEPTTGEACGGLGATCLVPGTRPVAARRCACIDKMLTTCSILNYVKSVGFEHTIHHSIGRPQGVPQETC